MRVNERTLRSVVAIVRVVVTFRRYIVLELTTNIALRIVIALLKPEKQREVEQERCGQYHHQRNQEIITGKTGIMKNQVRDHQSKFTSFKSSELRVYCVS